MNRVTKSLELTIQEPLRRSKWVSETAVHELSVIVCSALILISTSAPFYTCGNTHLTPSNFSEIHHPVGSGPLAESQLLARRTETLALPVSSSSSSSPPFLDFLDFLDPFFFGDCRGAPSGFLSLMRAASYFSPSRDIRCLQLRALTGTAA